MWANHNATDMWDKRVADPDNLTDIWSGQVDRAIFENLVQRWIEKYFTRKNYYKIDGKPVFSIYDMSNLVSGLGGLAQTAEAFEYFRAEVKKAGFPDLHLQMILTDLRYINVSGVDGSSEKIDEATLIKALKVDSLTHYQFVHFANVSKDYETLLTEVKAEHERVLQNYDLPYYPHASVGWDNNPRTVKPLPYVARENTPENFARALQLAKAYSEKHNTTPLITINSWNEWTETSYLEPDDKYGYGYLNAIKKTFLDEE
jgi:hypothetical protein